MVTFEEEKFLRILSILQLFLFQNCARNPSKVKFGRFQEILNKSRVFLIFEELNDFFWFQCIHTGFPKFLEAINILSFQKFFDMRFKIAVLVQ